MLKISKISISKLSFFICVAILLPAIYWILMAKPDKKDRLIDYDISSATVEFTEKLALRYINGDFEGHWKKDKKLCTDIPFGSSGINPSFLKCNPVYLSCVLKKEFTHINPLFSIGKFRFKASPSSMISTARGGIKFKVFEEKTSRLFWVKLKNSCRTIELPENKYLSIYQRTEAWDNYNRSFKIDKHYITQWDIENRYQNKFFYRNSTILKPSLDLNFEEKKNFCKSEGGTLLASHVFEAATMFPVDTLTSVKNIPKYHWGKIRKNDFILSKSFCKRMYVKGCSKYLPYELYNENGVSWIGLYHSLGGEIETFDNYFSSERVYKISSKFFPIDSTWHNVKMKNSKVINFPRTKNDKVGVAFRCMFID
mgnify:CR=1 FL=1